MKTVLRIRYGFCISSNKRHIDLGPGESFFEGTLIPKVIEKQRGKHQQSMDFESKIKKKRYAL